MNRDLAGLRLEDLPLNPHNIADIIFLKIFIRLFSDTVSCHIGLDIALQILYIAEGCLSHHAFLHDTARHAHNLPFHGVKILSDLCTVMGHIVFGNLKRILSRRLKLRQLLPPYFQ